MKYKVGDKVKIIKRLYSESPRLGEIMEIRQVRAESSVADYTLEDNENEWHIVSKDEIELIERIETFSSIKELIKLEKQDNNKYKQHEEICKKLNHIYISKNKDYGDSFLKVRKEYPEAVIIRLMDKLERLKTLYKGQEQLVNDESITDSLMDMANYCIMEVMEVEKNV